MNKVYLIYVYLLHILLIIESSIKVLYAVKYSADKVYIIGGYDGSSHLNKVLIFNPTNGFTHIEGPSLITKRNGHACALMSNGQQSKIVVAGGYNGSGLSSVEILDPTTNKWISGNKKLHFFENKNQMKHKIYIHAI